MPFNPRIETERALQPVHRWLESLDPFERIREATEVNEALLMEQARVAAHRRAAVRALRVSGFTLAEIAEATDMSPQRVSQIEAGT